MTPPNEAYESPNRFDHWDAMLADLDRVIPMLAPAAYKADPLGAWMRIEAMEREFRHVIQYARDAESGNRVLRERLEGGRPTMSEGAKMPMQEQAAENVCIALLDFWGGDDFADEPPGIEVYNLWLQWRVEWENRPDDA